MHLDVLVIISLGIKCTWNMNHVCIVSNVAAWTRLLYENAFGLRAHRMHNIAGTERNIHPADAEPRHTIYISSK